MSEQQPDPYFDLIVDEDLANNEWPRGLDEVKAKGTQCIAINAITKENFEAFKNIKTEKAGWTLARAINTGVINPTSFLGCHAGDLESYEVFGEPLFNEVIAKYHGGYDVTTGTHVTDMDSSKITVDLTEEAKSKIISTRIRVARNISTFPLNPGGTKETRLEIADLMEKVFAGLEGDLAGTFYRHTTMTPEQQQQLIDDHFLFRGKDKMQAASGYHEHWPHGRGIFVSNNKEFLLWINEGDHLRIISMEKGGDVKRVFDRLSRGIAAIEAGLKKELGIDDVFMRNSSHGCITCCPTNLGTGMRGSVHILVPKLIKSMGFKAIDEFARERGCQARGSTGEHSEVIDRIDISNWRRLGFKECDLVQDMIKCANELSKMEDEIDDQSPTKESNSNELTPEAEANESELPKQDDSASSEKPEADPSTADQPEQDESASSQKPEGSPSTTDQPEQNESVSSAKPEPAPSTTDQSSQDESAASEKPEPTPSTTDQSKQDESASSEKPEPAPSTTDQLKQDESASSEKPEPAPSSTDQSKEVESASTSATDQPEQAESGNPEPAASGENEQKEDAPAPTSTDEGPRVGENGAKAKSCTLL